MNSNNSNNTITITSNQPRSAQPTNHNSADTNHSDDLADIQRKQARARQSPPWPGIMLGAAFGLAGSALLVPALGGNTNPEAWLPSGILAFVVALTGVALALIITNAAKTIARSASATPVDQDALLHAVQDLTAQAALSDDARRVLNRPQERDLLVRTIEHDIDTGDWEAAIVLCEELADRFGYRTEAERYRQRIEAARAESTDRGIQQATSEIEGLILQRRWDEADRLALRAVRLYPDSPRVQPLRQRVEQARAAVKAELERRFLEAASGNNPEHALETLKELDQYLTVAEAEPLREVAKGVIGQARDNLGASFKLAVKDHRWSEAAQLGRRIINEFPNTRMAQEVRGLLDGILAKANHTGTASSPTPAARV